MVYRSLTLFVAISLVLVSLLANAQQPASTPVVKSADEQLIEYIKQLNDDTQKHREFVETYYTMLLKTIAAIGAILALIITVFGQSIKSSAKKEAESRVKNAIANIDQQVRVDAEKAIAEVKNELVAHVNKIKESKAQIDAEFEAVKSQIANINQLYADLREKVDKYFKINESINTFEYLKTDGSEVLYKVEQKVECINNDYPIAHIDHYMSTAPTGSVEILSSKPSHSVINSILPYRKGIRLCFEKNLCKGDPEMHNEMEWKIINGFTGEKEWFTILQMNESAKEVFILKLPIERKCKEVLYDEIGLWRSENLMEPKQQVTETSTHQIIKLELPRINIGMQHKITWIF